MGKRIISQRRGRGTQTYRSPSHRFKGRIKHLPLEGEGVVTDLVHCPGHSAPLMEVVYLSKEKNLVPAPEGIKVGDPISVGAKEIKPGNVLLLSDIPEEDRPKIVKQVTSMMGMMGRFSSGNPLHEKITSKHIDKIIDNADKSHDRVASDRSSTRRYLFCGAIITFLVFVGLLVFFKLQGSDDMVLNTLIGFFSFVGGVGGGFTISRFI